MKNKAVTFKSSLAKGEFTITIDESLNQLKGKVLAPQEAGGCQ